MYIRLCPAERINRAGPQSGSRNILAESCGTLDKRRGRPQNVCMPQTKKSSTPAEIVRFAVPRGTEDPIQFLFDSGVKPAQLALSWGFSHTDAVYRLKRYEYPPKVRTASRMGATFGWTAGEVIDHWVARVQR